MLRHYARLAVLRCEAGVWTRLQDCRALFPALSALTNLHYVGGDGQEVAPNPLAPLAVALPSPLQVAEIASELKRAAKQRSEKGSHYIIDRRSG